MECGKCRSANDADARYCVNCGSSLDGRADHGSAKLGRNWWYLLLLLPLLAFAAGVGYYKFYLPKGVAAIVNGEEISLADVDKAASDIADGKALPEEARSRMRYAVLSRMIAERIALQEARKAGITISQDELAEAVERRRTSAGMDQNTFADQINERYGSMAAFRRVLEQQLAINRFIDQRVTAGATDPATVSARMEQWQREIRGKAVVRIALAEELPAGNCGCCSGNRAPAPGRACDPRKGPPAGAGQLSPQARDAQKAALAYWQARNGDGPVDTRVRDFGCHIQVDIVKDERIAKSLRYQNGTITEM